MPELALVYYWRAGNQTAIEELLEDQVLQLGTTLQITQFEHWLALLPDSLFSHSFRLSLCQAILFVHQENELAEDRLLSLIQLCKQRADIARMALATAELSYFYYHQADYQKAYQLVSQICVKQLELRLQADL